MIRIYIYKGVIEDPFNEFFAKPSSLEFVLEEHNQLPNFLISIEQDLFKTGTTLNLLKRVEKQIASENYYSICILEPSNFDLVSDMKVLGD